MLTGRPKTALELRAEEEAELRVFASSPSLPHALVARAKLVLWSAEGKTNTEIASQLKWTKATVGKWCQRLMERRVSGLYDELRRGRPRSVSDEKVALLLRRTLKNKPPAGSHWSVRQAASTNGLSKSTLPEGLDVPLIVDNDATHKHAKVRLWLAQRPRFQIHDTPTYSSWLNQVERWFGLITQQAIRRDSFRSVKHLITRIDHFVQHYKSTCRPFAWNATADSILQKLARLCSRTSGTAH